MIDISPAGKEKEIMTWHNSNLILFSFNAKKAHKPKINNKPHLRLWIKISAINYYLGTGTVIC
jgi:hypothetical protein